jgi:hypothetical protein
MLSNTMSPVKAINFLWLLFVILQKECFVKKNILWKIPWFKKKKSPTKEN